MAECLDSVEAVGLPSVVNVVQLESEFDVLQLELFVLEPTIKFMVHMSY